MAQQYKLLSRSCPTALSKSVNEYLQEGWKLYGEPNQTTQESWGHFKKSGEYTVFSQGIMKE